MMEQLNIFQFDETIEDPIEKCIECGSLEVHAYVGGYWGYDAPMPKAKTYCRKCYYITTYIKHHGKMPTDAEIKRYLGPDGE